MRRRATRYLERFCWIAAVACVLPFALSTGGRALYASMASDDIAVVALPTEPQVTSDQAARPVDRPPSRYALWAPERLKDLLRYRAGDELPVAAVLRLPRQDRDIPVFAGISEITMTLGAGHLEDTGPLDGSGNIALSAHRDGSFRILKDVQQGDPLVLSVGGKDRLFTVSRQFIVEPDDVGVLGETERTTLTLITCYPIYYIGDAPQRYIVQAELVSDAPAKPEVVATGRHARSGLYSSIASQMRRNDL